MKVTKAHKIRLYPNNVQTTYLKKACGVSRFVYNWGLNEWSEQYKNGDKPSPNKLVKQFNIIKYEQFPWALEVTKTASQIPLVNLGKSFQNFFKNKKGYPKFKKKGRSKDTFYIQNSCVRLNKKKVKIPKLGWVRMAQPLRFLNSRILSAVVSRVSDKWFISFNVVVHEPNRKPSTSTPVVGIDVGIKTLAVTSEGEVFENPKSFRKNEKKLRKLNKSLSRKVKGSNNRKKARIKLSNLYYRISNVRKDSIHKATTAITKSACTLVIEDLNVKGMLKNRRLSKSLSDASLSEFHRQIKYKSGWFGVELIVAGRFYPSSKMCSRCGHIKDKLALSERTYICECGLKIDRDLNASINLKDLAGSHSERINACGERSSGFVGFQQNETTINETRKGLSTNTVNS